MLNIKIRHALSHYLILLSNNILIILLLLSSFLFSCEKSNVTTTTFDIMNFSNHSVKLSVYNANIGTNVTEDSTFIITNDSTLQFEYIINDYDANYPHPFGNNPDSALIVFDDTLFIRYEYADTSSRNILSIRSYIGGKHTTELYKYYYNITTEDYDTAVIISKLYLK